MKLRWILAAIIAVYGAMVVAQFADPAGPNREAAVVAAPAAALD